MLPEAIRRRVVGTGDETDVPNAAPISYMVGTVNSSNPVAPGSKAHKAANGGSDCVRQTGPRVDYPMQTAVETHNFAKCAGFCATVLRAQRFSRRF
jgi:hypothetical protein